MPHFPVAVINLSHPSLRRCEKIAIRQGGRAGVSEKLYSDTFPRVNNKVQQPCNVGYLTWPMTLTSKSSLGKALEISLPGSPPTQVIISRLLRYFTETKVVLDKETNVLYLFAYS